MAVTSERQGRTLVLAANGRVDSSNAAEFQEDITGAIEEDDPSVLLDLGGLSYISSAGLRVILLVAKTLNAKDAKFAVCSPSDPIREIFEISGFSQIIPMHPSQHEAIASLNG